MFRGRKLLPIVPVYGTWLQSQSSVAAYRPFQRRWRQKLYDVRSKVLSDLNIAIPSSSAEVISSRRPYGLRMLADKLSLRYIQHVV
jgi:hypothetical protein